MPRINVEAPNNAQRDMPTQNVESSNLTVSLYSRENLEAKSTAALTTKRLEDERRDGKFQSQLDKYAPPKTLNMFKEQSEAVDRKRQKALDNANTAILKDPGIISEMNESSKTYDNYENKLRALEDRIKSAKKNVGKKYEGQTLQELKNDHKATMKLRNEASRAYTQVQEKMNNAGQGKQNTSNAPSSSRRNFD